MARTVRIGVDVGGTFTDFVLYDEATGRAHTGKRLTTPEAPSVAIVEGIARLLSETGIDAEQLHSVVHGTTLITNTLIERTGARVGLIGSQGFRDVLEMAREIRYDLYDLFIEPPPTLVPRHRRLTVPERVSVDGEIVLELDEGALRRAVRHLVEKEGIEALAIAFMHSYRNAAPERRAGEIVRELYPDLPLTLSSDVAPEIREYERTSTACANAYVQPRVQKYLARLESDLAALGFSGALYIMLSGGGITTVAEAKKNPIRLIESGPAAGAMAASFIAGLIGNNRLISFDMGGTTAKMCLIEDGRPDHKFEFEAGRIRRFMKGSGIPLKVSVVDMIEIGAGGGSIARLDTMGLMKIGPSSAGAMPGPIAYGRGGTEPTVTDADLLLGYLNPAFFLGGEMALQLGDVQRAVADRLAAPLGLSVEKLALGIQSIVNENMAAATRMHLAEKGRDPRDYALVAFGGAGPVHAYALARLLKIGRIIIPLGAGVISALGFLVAAPATDDVRGHVARLEKLDFEAINALYAEMEADARALLLAAGAADDEIRFEWSADMRHVGQGFEIPVKLRRHPLGATDLPEIRRAFFGAYAARFDRVVEDVPIEAMNWRLHAEGPGSSISLARAGDGAETAGRGSREVVFDGIGALSCPVYDRYALAAGTVLAGPAVIEERESTCVVGPGASISIDWFMNLIIDIPSSEGTSA
jgi:N-methylhydantoinase A